MNLGEKSLSNISVADLHHRLNVPLHCRCDRFPELLPNAYINVVSKQLHCRSASRSTALHFHDVLLLRPQLPFGQTKKSLLVLGLSNSDHNSWLLGIHVHGRLWIKIFQLVPAELRVCHE